jgi:hypothetical protein
MRAEFGCPELVRVSKRRTNLSEVADDLEFFLDLAQIAIEERDQIIRELVKVTETVLSLGPEDSRSKQDIENCRVMIAKARALVAY